jgi:hypothetical protein
MGNPIDRVVLGPDLLKEMEDQMVKIKQNLKATQDREKKIMPTRKGQQENLK